jgi:hypothetical protein
MNYYSPHFQIVGKLLFQFDGKCCRMLWFNQLLSITWKQRHSAEKERLAKCPTSNWAQCNDEKSILNTPFSCRRMRGIQQKKEWPIERSTFKLPFTVTERKNNSQREKGAVKDSLSALSIGVAPRCSVGSRQRNPAMSRCKG